VVEVSAHAAFQRVFGNLASTVASRSMLEVRSAC
jgi:hypothetical protein